ncbi:ATP-binding protein [Sphaerisporangium sp. NPDC005288]|uniref:ATP-binding protein n=1 Tax=Sphaerisporangium sp. NPDC005288 TaxID=3155114 RepID=UPI0033BDA1A3
MSPLTLPAAAVGAELRLVGTPFSVGQARALVAGMLPGFGRLDEVLLVVSELATNAVLHSASGAAGGTFTVRVELEAGAVTVAVVDQGPALVPARRPDGEGGHGLALVAELADAYEMTVTEHGRTAWCRLDWPTPVGPDLGGPL